MSNISEKIDYLISRDSKGKIRVVEISYKWDESQHGFIIFRTTGILGGKMTEQPNILIQRGKASRTIRQQVELEYNSNKKKYLDKGYKSINSNPNEYSIEELEAIIGSVITNTNNVPRPQLAKQADKVSKKTFDKKYYASRKINGTRCLIYCKDGEIKTASRGATNYDIALLHIITNPKLINFFKNHPEVILDGEIYKHGMSLNIISGICRKQATTEDGKDLQFYLYDIVELDKPFTERLQLIQEYAKELELLDFNPLLNNNELELAIQVVPHVPISGYDNMKKLHDEYVSDGWEGLVIRLAESVYKPGARGNDWIKIKEYFDAEYPIVGLSEGLRDEDLCFILETPNGQQFKCKPMGDRNKKQWYRDNINNLIGKPLTIKYFEMSGVSGSEVPQQPIGIEIRDYE